jgi:hypothetical protein
MKCLSGGFGACCRLATANVPRSTISFGESNRLLRPAGLVGAVATGQKPGTPIGLDIDAQTLGHESIKLHVWEV